MQVKSKEYQNPSNPPVSPHQNESISQYQSFNEDNAFPRITFKNLPVEQPMRPEEQRVQIWPKKVEEKVEKKLMQPVEKSSEQHPSNQINRSLYDMPSHISIANNSSEELSNEIKQAAKQRKKIFTTEHNGDAHKEVKNLSNEFDQNKRVNKSNNPQSIQPKTQIFERKTPPTEYFEKILLSNQSMPVYKTSASPNYAPQSNKPINKSLPFVPEPKYSFLPQDPGDFLIESAPQVKRESSKIEQNLKKQPSLLRQLNQPRTQPNQQISQPIYQQKSKPIPTKPLTSRYSQNQPIIEEQYTPYQLTYPLPSMPPAQYSNLRTLTRANRPSSFHHDDNQFQVQTQFQPPSNSNTMQKILRVYPLVLNRIQRNERDISSLSYKLDEIILQGQHRERLLYDLLRKKQLDVINKEKQIIAYRQGIDQIQQNQRVKKNLQAKQQLEMQRARRLEAIIEENHRLCSQIVNKKVEEEELEKKLKQKFLSTKMKKLYSYKSSVPSTTASPYFLGFQPILNQTRSAQDEPQCRHHHRRSYI